MAKQETITAEIQKSAPLVGNVMKDADLSKYVKLGKTAGGNKTHDTNDSVAVRLRGLAIEDVYREASKVLGVTEEVLYGQYGGLNVGMQRMNLGNRMRAALKPKSEKAPAKTKSEKVAAKAPAKAPAKEAAKPKSEKAPAKAPAKSGKK